MSFYPIGGLSSERRDAMNTMPRLIYDTWMSLDGFITGPEPRPAQPLGRGGDQVHDWMAGIADFRYRVEASGERSGIDADVGDELHRRTGAILIGRTMFDVGEEPWGPDPPFAMPVFVVTHRHSARSRSRAARPTRSSPTGSTSLSKELGRLRPLA